MASPGDVIGLFLVVLLAYRPQTNMGLRVIHGECDDDVRNVSQVSGICSQQLRCARPFDPRARLYRNGGVNVAPAKSDI